MQQTVWRSISVMPSAPATKRAQPPADTHAASRPGQALKRPRPGEPGDASVPSLPSQPSGDRRKGCGDPSLVDAVVDLISDEEDEEDMEASDPPAAPAPVVQPSPSRYPSAASRDPRLGMLGSGAGAQAPAMQQNGPAPRIITPPKPTPGKSPLGAHATDQAAAGGYALCMGAAIQPAVPVAITSPGLKQRMSANPTAQQTAASVPPSGKPPVSKKSSASRKSNQQSAMFRELVSLTADNVQHPEASRRRPGSACGLQRAGSGTDSLPSGAVSGGSEPPPKEPLPKATKGATHAAHRAGPSPVWPVAAAPAGAAVGQTLEQLGDAATDAVQQVVKACFPLGMPMVVLGARLAPAAANCFRALLATAIKNLRSLPADRAPTPANCKEQLLEHVCALSSTVRKERVEQLNNAQLSVKDERAVMAIVRGVEEQLVEQLMRSAARQLKRGLERLTAIDVLTRLPEDLPCHPAFEEYRVPDSDPRVGLRGELGVITNAQAENGTIMGHYSGYQMMATDYRQFSKHSPARLLHGMAKLLEQEEYQGAQVVLPGPLHPYLQEMYYINEAHAQSVVESLLGVCSVQRRPDRHASSNDNDSQGGPSKAKGSKGKAKGKGESATGNAISAAPEVQQYVWSGCARRLRDVVWSQMMEELREGKARTGIDVPEDLLEDEQVIEPWVGVHDAEWSLECDSYGADIETANTLGRQCTSSLTNLLQECHDLDVVYKTSTLTQNSTLTTTAISGHRNMMARVNDGAATLPDPNDTPGEANERTNTYTIDSAKTSNCYQLAIQVVGWPLLFLVTNKMIRRGAAANYMYGPYYWHAVFDRQTHVDKLKAHLNERIENKMLKKQLAAQLHPRAVDAGVAHPEASTNLDDAAPPAASGKRGVVVGPPGEPEQGDARTSRTRSAADLNATPLAPDTGLDQASKPLEVVEEDSDEVQITGELQAPPRLFPRPGGLPIPMFQRGSQPGAQPGPGPWHWLQASAGTFGSLAGHGQASNTPLMLPAPPVLQPTLSQPQQQGVYPPQSYAQPLQQGHQPIHQPQPLAQPAYQPQPLARPGYQPLAQLGHQPQPLANPGYQPQPFSQLMLPGCQPQPLARPMQPGYQLGFPMQQQQGPLSGPHSHAAGHLPPPGAVGPLQPPMGGVHCSTVPSLQAQPQRSGHGVQSTNTPSSSSGLQSQPLQLNASMQGNPSSHPQPLQPQASVSADNGTAPDHQQTQPAHQTQPQQTQQQQAQAQQVQPPQQRIGLSTGTSMPSIQPVVPVRHGQPNWSNHLPAPPGYNSTLPYPHLHSQPGRWGGVAAVPAAASGAHAPPMHPGGPQAPTSHMHPYAQGLGTAGPHALQGISSGGTQWPNGWPPARHSSDSGTAASASVIPLRHSSDSGAALQYGLPYGAQGSRGPMAPMGPAQGYAQPGYLPTPASGMGNPSQTELGAASVSNHAYQGAFGGPPLSTGHLNGPAPVGMPAAPMQHLATDRATPQPVGMPHATDPHVQLTSAPSAFSSQLCGAPVADVRDPLPVPSQPGPVAAAAPEPTGVTA